MTLTSGSSRSGEGNAHYEMLKLKLPAVHYHEPGVGKGYASFLFFVKVDEVIDTLTFLVRTPVQGHFSDLASLI